MTRIGKWLLGLGLVIAVAILGYFLILMLSMEKTSAPGPDLGVSTKWETEVTLTSDHPVVVRGFQVGVEPTAERMTEPELHIGARPTDGRDGIHDTDVWVSIFDPTNGDGAPDAAGSGHATLDGWSGSGRAFKECDDKPCSAKYVMVVRWLAPTDGTEVHVTLWATLSATLLTPVSRGIPTEPTPMPLPVGLSIAEDASYAFDGKPAMLVARASGSTRITTDMPVVDERFTLHVPAVTLRRGLEYPTLGRVLLTVGHAGSSHKNVAPWTELTGPRGTVKSLAGIALDTEWLSGCRGGVDCDVPLDLRFAFGASPAGGSAALPPDAWAEASWAIEAHLEVLSAGDALLSSGFTLTRDEPSRPSVEPSVGP